VTRNWDGWPDIAATYDTVAADYAERFADELAGKPADRALLDRFAALTAGRGPVCDIGCGPAGHVGAYLADAGVTVAGLDLSVGALVTAAALAGPATHVGFAAADMRALPVVDGALAGIVAFYSLIHLPRPVLPEAFAEFHRVLAPGAPMLLAMHDGTGEIGRDDWLGHQVQVRLTLVAPDELAELATAAGFTVLDNHVRPPAPDEGPRRRIYLLAQR
jgi:SAM-dependent methyltransferase